MGRLLKILGFIVAGFLALILVGSIALYLLFDQDDFREQASIAVEEATGRVLVIEGDINLSLFPWLAIDIGETRLGNAAGFGDAPFASFERARLSVRLMPMLLKREISVGTASIETLQLNLEINKSGRSNWQDLTELSDAAAEAEAPEPAGGELPKLEIGGVEVRNAFVSYVDRQSGDDFQLVGFSLNSGAIVAGEPVQLSSGFGFKLMPADISGEIDMQTELAFGGDVVSMHDFVLEGQIDGIAQMPVTLKLALAALEANTATETLAPGTVEVSVVGVDLSADVEPFSYAGEPTVNARLRIEPFSPRSLMQRMDIEAPVTADPNALGKVSIDATASMTESSISLSDLLLALDDSIFKGGLVVPRSANGTYRLDLAADTIDLNRYMAPADEAEAQSDVAEAPIEIPVELLRPLNARGSLKIAEAHLGGLKFENVVMELQAANGDVRLHPIAASFYEGNYNGDVRIDVTGDVPVLSVNENISDVQLGSLAKAVFQQENISGAINGSFQLNGRGQDFAEIQSSLNGNMSFDVHEGALEGTDIWYELRRARALLKQEAAPEPELPPRTRFTTLAATGVVTDGIFRNDDFVAEIPYMRLTGKGSVDLVAASLDYRLTARVLERPEFAQGASAAELDEFTEAVIPLRITGPLSSPSVKPDIEDMLRKEIEDELKRQITDKLFGKDKSEPADTGDADAAQEPKKEQKLEDVAKKALLDLLNK